MKTTTDNTKTLKVLEKWSFLAIQIGAPSRENKKKNKNHQPKNGEGTWWELTPSLPTIKTRNRPSPPPHKKQKRIKPKPSVATILVSAEILRRELVAKWPWPRTPPVRALLLGAWPSNWIRASSARKGLSL